jgi:hypothetical protein
MSAPQPDDLPHDEILSIGDDVTVDSSDAILVIIDGPWDTTVRPRPPHIPPYSPGAIPPGRLRYHQAPPPEEKGE